MFALVSPGASPGVTTAALALALTWPAGVIVAECDPGGGDVLAGLLAGHLPAGRGLTEHAIEAGRDSAAAAVGLSNQLVQLEGTQTRNLLRGLTDPRQALSLATAWPAVAATLTAQRVDVIADCGRLDAGATQPAAVIAAARTVALVMRPTLRQVWLARSRIDMLTQLLDGRERLVLLLTGPGTHTARDVAEALQVPVAAALPNDSRAAALLSEGLGRRSHLSTSALMRSARTAGAALRKHAAAETRGHPRATTAS